MSDEVTVERRDDVAVITLTAPERRNALSGEMARELGSACEEIDSDHAIGAVVVRGEGPYFCAGADRRALADVGRDPASPDAYAALGEIYQSFTRIGELEPPTIAAVRGGAVGAGLNLMLATDLRIVEREAQIASGFLPIGLHSGGGHAALLGRTAGRETAAALALFGEVLDGAEAARLGLAWQAVGAEEVDALALGLAKRAAADPQLARATARSFRSVLGPPPLSWEAALDVERATQMWSMRRKDLAAAEGEE